MKPDIDKLDLHELRTRKDELQADLRAAWARIAELEMIEAGLAKPAAESIGWSASVQRRIEPELAAAEPAPEPGPNAHPEGEDAP